MSKVCPRCSELLPDEAGFCPFDGAELQKNTDRFLGKIVAARYRLTRKLGSGGMSVVYLARHELISRLSALKILRPELSQLPEHRERFLREARAVNRINHENIVEITDVGESDGLAYLVMEYVEGESLLAQIQGGPIPWERGVRIALQVASALARTHQAGIIHRDLKPENILLVPRAASRSRGAAQLGAAADWVKLTDFGIAKMVGEPTLTMNEQLFGTPGYIAPEYVAGRPIDGRADIYSLAVVLYELIAGELPFEGRGQSDLLLKPLTTSPIPIGRRVRGLPEDLESLVMRCLSREPDDRPHDAFALHDALAGLLDRHGSTASIVPSTELRGVQSDDAIGAEVRREPLATVIDVIGRREIETPDLARIPTKEMCAKWASALVELELRITAARRAGGEAAALAARAAELASVAGEMLPRLERATQVVAGLQANVDRLEAEGREFRGNLGHAIDVLVHDRSRERAHLAAVRGRRAALSPSSQGGAVPTGPWETQALESEEQRAASVVEDLRFQIETLQRQLDDKNEAHELELVRATGRLEGALSALRRLTNEVAGTIDDGIELLAS